MRADLVSILVPVYNNATHLRELYARIRSALTDHGIEFEVLLVNDGSADDSWNVISEIAAHDLRVKGLALSRNFGQHAAISAALEHATGTRFVLMDADLQDRPEVIPQLLGRLTSADVDIVYTRKQGGHEGWVRSLTSLAFHKFVDRATQSKTAPNVGTFRAFNRDVADALLRYRERAIVYGPLMHTMGFRTDYVEVARDPRSESKSSYSFRKRIALAFQSIVSYSTLPQRVLLWFGGTVSVLSVGYLLIILMQYLLVGGGLPQGLTLIAVLLLFLIGILMAALGVVASYLFLIYRETLDRPRYHVQRALNVVAKQ
jgi:polyisoprenyl-phosphate glycosyltransferase